MTNKWATPLRKYLAPPGRIALLLLFTVVFVIRVMSEPYWLDLAILGSLTTTFCWDIALLTYRNHWLGRWIQRRRDARALRRGFDLWPARWLASLLFLAPALPFWVPPLPEWLALSASITFGVVLCGYLAHLLFFRLQFSLIELIAFTLILGSAFGLTASAPGGLTLLPWVGPVLAAAVLFGAVEGCITARIMGVTNPYLRLLHMLDSWAMLALFPMLAWGIFLLAGPDTFISESMRRWAAPLLILAAITAATGVWAWVRVSRRAWQLIEEAGEPRPE